MARSLLLLLLLALAGCTYRKAMEAGVLHQQEKDYVAALADFGLALEERPGDPEATRRIAAIREAQADAAIAEAESFMARAAYEEALTALQAVEAIDDDRPEVFLITQKARQELEDGFKGLIAAGRDDDAYAMAVRIRGLFGNESYLNRGLLDLRKRYIDASRTAYEEGRYADALASLDAITAREPDQADAIAIQRRSILTGWADEHAARAHRLLREDNPGGAAASFLRAVEIAGRPTDQQAAEEVLARLATEGSMGFRVDAGSTRPRDQAIAELLRARLAALPNTRMVERSPALTVVLQGSPFQCAETVLRTPQTSTFIAATVPVPHPEYLAATARIEAAEREAVAAQRKVDALWAVLSTLSPRLQADQAEMVDLLTRRPALEAAVEEAQTQRDLAEELGADSLVAWEQALTERTAALADLVARQAELEKARAPLQAESEAAEREVQQTMAAVRAAKEAAAAAEAERAAGPQTIDRDVDDTLHWDLEDWKRTCKAELSVHLRPTWPTELKLVQVHTHEATTEDQAHIGHVDAELEEDPKAYPRTDEELLAEVDTANLDALDAWLKAVVDEHFAQRTTAAAIRMSSDPLRGTSEALRLLLGAPERLSPSAPPLFDTQIRRAWDLETTVFVPEPASGQSTDDVSPSAGEVP